MVRVSPAAWAVLGNDARDSVVSALAIGLRRATGVGRLQQSGSGFVDFFLCRAERGVALRKLKASGELGPLRAASGYETERVRPQKV